MYKRQRLYCGGKAQIIIAVIEMIEKHLLHAVSVIFIDGEGGKLAVRCICFIFAARQARADNEAVLARYPARKARRGEVYDGQVPVFEAETVLKRVVRRGKLVQFDLRSRR